MKPISFLVNALVVVFVAMSCSKKNKQSGFYPSPSYDIIIIAGQSNTCFGYGYDSSTLVPSKVLELGRYEKNMKIIPATPSLYNWSRDPLKSSFGYDFARYYLNRDAAPKNPVLIVGCGMAGSSFMTNNWSKGDNLYEDLIERTNSIIKQYPHSRVVVILWQQGESDIENCNYQNDLDSMIVNMRSDILHETNIPFLLGGMVPYWTNLQNDRIKLQNIIKETENRLENCFYVDPEGISKPDNEFDIIHFSHENHVELAKRYYTKFEQILPH